MPANPCYAPVTLADRLTGLHAVSAALYAREKTGRGQAVEVPMLESFVPFTLSDHVAGLSDAEIAALAAAGATILADKP